MPSPAAPSEDEPHVHGSQRVLPGPQEQLARCLAEAPLGTAGGPAQPGSIPRPQPAHVHHLASGGPAGASSGASDTAAGSWKASRRPEWPFLVARYTFKVGLPGRETAAHSLQSDQGGIAAASTVGKIGSTEAVRADTRSARGELTESPRSCPTRLCRTEGSASNTQSRPLPRAARPSEPL